MSHKQYNNNFFSYQGTINRKNYVINMLIVVALLIGIYFLRFDNFASYIRPEFLYTILIFMVNLFQFVMLMSAISLIYRRIADFSDTKSITFNNCMKNFFFFLFIFPILYLFCIRYFIDIIPTIRNIIDLIVIFIIVPIGIISSIILAFIKGSQ